MALNVWREDVELLDRICSDNAAHTGRTQRKSRQAELHYLIVKEAKRLGLIEATD